MGLKQLVPLQDVYYKGPGLTYTAMAISKGIYTYVDLISTDRSDPSLDRIRIRCSNKNGKAMVMHYIVYRKDIVDLSTTLGKLLYAKV
jgi:hypothetical protein